MSQVTFVNRLRRLIKSFEPPFMPAGFVEFHSFRHKGNLSYTLEIGDRDVNFDEGGLWNGQGSALPGDWNIRRRGRRHAGLSECGGAYQHWLENLQNNDPTKRYRCATTTESMMEEAFAAGWASAQLQGA